jgi:hypothetical protein
MAAIRDYNRGRVTLEIGEALYPKHLVSEEGFCGGPMSWNFVVAPNTSDDAGFVAPAGLLEFQAAMKIAESKGEAAEIEAIEIDAGRSDHAV